MTRVDSQRAEDDYCKFVKGSGRVPHHFCQVLDVFHSLLLFLLCACDEILCNFSMFQPISV